MIIFNKALPRTLTFHKEQKDLNLFWAGDESVIKRIRNRFQKSLKSYLKLKYKDYLFYFEDLVQDTITIILEKNGTINLPAH